MNPNWVLGADYSKEHLLTQNNVYRDVILDASTRIKKKSDK